MSRVIRIQFLALLFLLLSSAVCLASFQVGDKGEEVSEIQSALTKLGYPVEVDGYFGSAMEYQVKNFQSVWGLEPDGIVGKDTYYAIMGKNIMVSRGGSSMFMRRLVQTSFAYIGVPYVFGGTTPGGLIVRVMFNMYLQNRVSSCLVYRANNSVWGKQYRIATCV